MNIIHFLVCFKDGYKWILLSQLFDLQFFSSHVIRLVGLYQNVLDLTLVWLAFSHAKMLCFCSILEGPWVNC